MARSRDLSLVNRDEQIIAAVSEGKRSYADISREFGVSKARVSQIVQRYYEDLPDDGTRDLQRAKMEHAQEIVLAIMNGPGKRVVSPGGSPVFERNDDGTINYEKPLYDEEIKIKAALAGVTISERLARSFGLDRPKQKQKDESDEFDSAMEYMNQLIKQNKELQERLELHEISASHPEQPELYEAEVIETGKDDQASPEAA